MKIKDTVKLPGIRSIVTGTHFGIPAARYMEGSVVRSSHLGFFAKKRAWRSYHKAGGESYPADAGRDRKRREGFRGDRYGFFRTAD